MLKRTVLAKNEGSSSMFKRDFYLYSFVALADKMLYYNQRVSNYLLYDMTVWSCVLVNSLQLLQTTFFISWPLIFHAMQTANTSSEVFSTFMYTVTS